MISPGARKHPRHGITVDPDRFFSVNGPPMDRLPGWGAVRRPAGMEVHLHPAISYEIHYRVPHWVLIFTFNGAETRGALGDAPLTRGRRARGYACLIPPGVRIRVIQEAPQEFLGLGISQERFASIADATAGPGRWDQRQVSSEGDPALAALCGELRRAVMSETSSSDEYLGAVCGAAAARLITDGLNQEERATDQLFSATAPGPEALSPAVKRRVMAEIEQRLGEKITIGDLADAVGLSRSHFTRAFTASFGESPGRFLMQSRISRARELLLNGEQPITEIALTCGFADHAHFSTTFRKEIGLAPRAYRKAAAERDGERLPGGDRR